MREQFTGGYESHDEDAEVCCMQSCTRLTTSSPTLFNIAFFEFFGMVLFSYVVIVWNGIITFPGVWVVQTGMFLALVLAGSFGCGHLNPALTLACVIKKENRTPILTGLYYWVVQYAAAFAGTFIAWAYNTNLIAPFPNVHPTTQSVWIAFGKQIFGSFLFLLAVLIMISSDTTFTTNNMQTWFCVPLCLIAVCGLFGLGLGTNPAQAIAFQVAYYALAPARPGEDKTVQLQAIWSVVIGATIGGALAGIVFEFVYRPYTKVYREELFNNGETRSPLKVTILEKSNVSAGSGRRVTDIEMA